MKRAIRKAKREIRRAKGTLDLEGLRDQQDQHHGEVHYLWAEIKDLRERIEVLEGCDNPDNYKQSVASSLRWRWEQFKGKRKAVRRG